MRKVKEEVQIFDFHSKKWLVLTPEEWVRQHVMNYLVNVKGYPASRIGVEKEIELNDTKKRFDIVVYGETKEPFILIECKAPYVELTGKVLEQALRYNLTLKAHFVMISNGVSDFILYGMERPAELPPFIK